jgi:hypothetical protein
VSKYLLMLLLIPLPLHAADVPGPEGVTIELTDESSPQFIRIRAVGESDLLIGNRKDIQRATKVATLKAKAAIARYLGEDVKTEEVVEQISESAQQSNGKTTLVSRKDAEKLIETIRNLSSEFMKGIIVLEQNVDQAGKRVIVTVGTSEKSRRTADWVKKAFSQDSTYRPFLSTPDAEEVQSETASQEIRRSQNYDEFF